MAGLKGPRLAFLPTGYGDAPSRSGRFGMKQVSRHLAIRPTLVVFVSGMLLSLAFPKADLGLVAWLAFVPLLRVVWERPLSHAFFYGWVSGMGFYLCTVYWVVHTIGLYSNIPPAVAVIPLFLMCSILAVYTGTFALGVRWCKEESPAPSEWRRLLVFGPLLWVSLEWLRSFFFIGFPWVSLGYSQHRSLNLIQIAEVTSVYGISALVIFGNLVLFTLVSTRGPGRGRLLLGTAALVLCVIAWGSWRRSQLAALPHDQRLRVGVVQGNIEQHEKWQPAFQVDTIAHYAHMTRQAAAADLIVWPETAVPFFFQSDDTYRGQILNLARETTTPLLFGSPAFRRTARQLTLFNRAYLLSADAEVVDRYDKMILTPFGEFIPFQNSLLFFLDKLVEGIGDFAPGTRPTVFTLPKTNSSGKQDDLPHAFGVLICYEGIFPDFARHFVKQGATFLVNITNDAWFGRTAAPYQHLMMEALRAVENRVPLVRAANTGISAVVDVTGAIQTRTELYETTFFVKEITWPRVRSFYTRYGDVFAHLCSLGCLGMLGGVYYHRHQRGRQADSSLSQGGVCWPSSRKN